MTNSTQDSLKFIQPSLNDDDILNPKDDAWIVVSSDQKAIVTINTVS